MLTYLIIALGSALGGAGRYAVSTWVTSSWGDAFPWGTLVVNASGSLIIGVIAAIADPACKLYVSSPMQQFLIIGIMGGFTTFSSFSLQTLSLIKEGQWIFATGNVVGSVLLCLFSVWIGFFFNYRK